MTSRNPKQVRISVLAIGGVELLFLWSVPASVDFRLRVRRRLSVPYN
jgi:hypothetical protein